MTAAPDNRKHRVSPAQPQGFPPEARLHHKSEFDAVFAGKRSAGDRGLVVYALPNGRARSRLGLVVSRRFGNAVRRNRFKRLVREAFRLSQAKLPQGVDFVVLPKHQAPDRVADVQDSLIALARRAFRRPGKQ
jgi:ribonuclease P protein component